MIIKFTIPGEPQGKGRPRFSKVGGFVKTYTPDQTVIYENLVALTYRAEYGNAIMPPDTRIEMRINAFYTIPKSISKKKAELMRTGKLRPAKKPDADNILKIVADSLNGIAYKDDAQLVDTMVRKFYSDNPRVEVMIREVE